MAEYLELNYWQVGCAVALILVNGVISLVLRLKLEKTLAIASIRTIVQLSLVGLVLESVFRWQKWYLVVALALVMTIIAGVAAMNRSQRKFAGLWIDTILAMWISSWLITGFALLTVIYGIEPWYHPQYLIPLLGMILGNTLNGISVGLNSFTESLARQREEIEVKLSLGATRFEASRETLQQAIRTGMIPIMNSMMIVGIVSLPGMMTGQIISGMPPMEAVKYQIVIMFLIASATALGTVLVVQLCYLRMFNAWHQFLPDRLKQN